MRTAAIVTVLLAAALPAAAGPAPSGGTSLTALAPAGRAARQAADLASIAVYRAGLARTLAYTREHPELFPASPPSGTRLLRAAERDAVRAAWKSALDFTLALESIERFHGDCFLLADARERARSFHAAHGAFLASYRAALELIERVENDPKLGGVLNDPVEELGLPAGSYDRYKFAFLNVAAATRFAAYALAGAALPPAGDAAHARAQQEDAARILAAGRGRGEALTAANAVNVLRRLGARALFPVQAGVSAWMGDTKVLRQERALITPAQIEALRRRMLPGDIMLQRREWYLSNVGLPGFWSHAALYVGTPGERRAFFGADEVRRWVEAQGESSGDLELLLARRHPKAHAAAIAAQEHGRPPRVLEAISEGVVFTTLEHSAGADSVVVLRPRLARREIAAAIARAFGYAGRPYDYDFDFQTDSALVCTELVYKAYEPGPGRDGLHIRLEEILGRTAIPANAIARQLDGELESGSPQLEFVAFLDGREKLGIAVEAGIEEFRRSWRRPKWHVLVQDEMGDGPP